MHMNGWTQCEPWRFLFFWQEWYSMVHQTGKWEMDLLQLPSFCPSRVVVVGSNLSTPRRHQILPSTATLLRWSHVTTTRHAPCVAIQSQTLILPLLTIWVFLMVSYPLQQWRQSTPETPAWGPIFPITACTTNHLWPRTAFLPTHRPMLLEQLSLRRIEQSLTHTDCRLLSRTTPDQRTGASFPGISLRPRC